MVYTTSDFIHSAKKKHGDKYDYSLVRYKNGSKKINIICKIHGVFKQRPKNHISGNGCKKCIKYKYTDDKFILLSMKKHSDKYLYNEVKYHNCKTPVIIICKIHGSFNITPDKHLQGMGCPKCAKISRKNAMNNKRKLHKIYQQHKEIQLQEIEEIQLIDIPQKIEEINIIPIKKFCYMIDTFGYHGEYESYLTCDKCYNDNSNGDNL